MHDLSLLERIKKNAQTCVKCAACLPACPTFNATHDENESPRGRIALLEAVATHTLAPTPALKKHIDQCLACRRCETVCPAQVPYGELLVDGRTLLESHLASHASLFFRFGAQLIAFYPRLTKIGLKLIRRLISIVPFLVPKRLQKAHALLKETPISLQRFRGKQFSAFTQTARGRVALFIGCTGEALDFTTLKASIHVLRHLGFNVIIPKTQLCCGSIHLHHGQKEKAEALLSANEQAFSDLDVDAIVGFSTGCVAPLIERNGHSLTKICDINRFIAEHFTDSMTVVPRMEQVAVHVPCSQSQILSEASQPLFILKKIPQLTLLPFPPQSVCCGGAGTYFLEHATLSSAVFSDFLQQFPQELPSTIVTSNFGCALQFKSELKKRYPQRTFRIIHPVVLLAEQLF